MRQHDDETGRVYNVRTRTTWGERLAIIAGLAIIGLILLTAFGF